MNYRGNCIEFYVTKDDFVLSDCKSVYTDYVRKNSNKSDNCPNGCE